MKKAIYALLAVFVVGIVASGAVLAFGRFGNPEVSQALESDDYEGWKKAMQDGITEQRFEQMKERHARRMQGREEVRAAIEDGDYEAWKEAVSDLNCPRAEQVLTEGDFNKLVELHESRQGSCQLSGERGRCPATN